MFTSLVLSSLIGLASAPPIELASCKVSQPITVWSNNDDPITGGNASALHVRFSNAAAEPISRVTFTLADGATINDVGTFSPGVAINHNLRLARAAGTSCVVSAVLFADGTIWDATEMTPAPSARFTYSSWRSLTVREGLNRSFPASRKS